MAYKSLRGLNARIERERKRTDVVAFFAIRDNSVTTQLRLDLEMGYRIRPDQIKYPRDLSGQNPAARTLREFEIEIDRCARLYYYTESYRLSANSRTKTGDQQRTAAIAAFRLVSGNEFVRRSPGKKAIAAAWAKIRDLQARQKALIPKIRATNAGIVAGRKATAQQKRDALTAGRFWECDAKTLKNYFHPPFAAKALVDVSEKWRAALFVETESTNVSNTRGQYWHKSEPTDQAWLCGIDDNGDEWGFNPSRSHDRFDFDDTVETAMAAAFGVSIYELPRCTRQGDLLFCPVSIPATQQTVCSLCGRPWEPVDINPVETRCSWCQYGLEHRVEPPTLTPQTEPWEIRESHTVASDGLERNGRYFRSPSTITVTHTSHAPVTLDPGEYRLYTIDKPGAD